jgi:hypothetical protein
LLRVNKWGRFFTAFLDFFNERPRLVRFQQKICTSRILKDLHPSERFVAAQLDRQDHFQKPDLIGHVHAAVGWLRRNLSPSVEASNLRPPRHPEKDDIPQLHQRDGLIGLPSIHLAGMNDFPQIETILSALKNKRAHFFFATCLAIISGKTDYLRSAGLSILSCVKEYRVSTCCRSDCREAFVCCRTRA